MVDAAGSSAAAGPAQTGSPHRASFAGSSTPWPGVPPYLLDTPIAVQLHPSEVASRAIQQGATTDSALERGKMRVSSAVAAASAPGAGSGEGQLVPSVPLPTAWNSKDKCSLLQLSNGSLTVTYNGVFLRAGGVVCLSFSLQTLTNLAQTIAIARIDCPLD